MPAMTLRQMHFTLLCRVCQAGEETFIDSGAVYLWPCNVQCSFSSHKVVGISTVSRKEHPIAQTRELECTQRVIPQVQKRGTYWNTVTSSIHNVTLCIPCCGIFPFPTSPV